MPKTKGTIILNQKYGNLIPIELYSTKGRPGKTRKCWTCICDCGRIQIMRTDKLRNDNIIRACSECTNSKYLPKHGWKGVGEMGKEHFNSIIRSAKKRNIEFNLTMEYIWNLFLKQNRQCALSGIKIEFAQLPISRNRTASLDRIDPNIGYIEGNVQWVHKDINITKLDYTQQEYIEICKLVTENQKTLNLGNEVDDYDYE